MCSSSRSPSTNAGQGTITSAGLGTKLFSHPPNPTVYVLFIKRVDKLFYGSLVYESLVRFWGLGLKAGISLAISADTKGRTHF